MPTDTTPRTWTSAEQRLNRLHVAEALMSGRYAYGRGCLCRNGHWCWAGVCCDVLNAVYPGLIGVGVHRDDPRRITFGGQSAVLPDAAVAALGLADAFGGFEGPHGRDTLIALNDAGEPFTAIATLLLEPPAGLLRDDEQASLARVWRRVVARLDVAMACAVA